MIKLTVGLIVKDEEDYLEECLQALQPLLRSVSGELIIADTGSRDHTIEIAKKFTDQVYYYEWCSDFSKARNFVLEKARGEWFMQIDADEVLGDAQPLSQFFCTSEYREYNDARVIIRNYLSEDSKNYKDYYIGRLFKRGTDRTYLGRVHEYVPQIGPIKDLDVIVNHYGYMNSSYNSLRKKEKKNRNLPLLLEELKNSPNDVRLLYHLAKEYNAIHKNEEAESICIQITGMQRREDIEFFITETFYLLTTIYIEKKEYNKLVKCAELYCSKKEISIVRGLDVIYNAIYALIEREDYQDALEYFNVFWTYKNKFEDRIKCGESGIRSGAETLKDEMQNVERYQYARVLEKCGDYERLLKCLLSIEGENANSLTELIYPLWMNLLSEKKCFGALLDYYQKLCETGSEKADLPCGIFMKLWTDKPELASEAALYFGEARDDFMRVQLLLLSEHQGKGVDKHDLVQLLGILPIKLYYGSLLVLALKYQVDCTGYINRCSYKEIDDIITYLFAVEPEFKSMLFAGTIWNLPENLPKIIYFKAKSYEQFILQAHFAPEHLKSLMSVYIEAMRKYIDKLYRPEMCTRETRSELPDLYHFVLIMEEALSFCKKENWANYLVSLRQAVKVYPPMKRCIRILSEDIEKKVEEQKNARNEFNEYGKKVKVIIRRMIATNALDLAAEAVTAYERVNPGDPEIKEFKEKIGL